MSSQQAYSQGMESYVAETTVAASKPISVGSFRRGFVGGVTGTTLTFHGSPTEGGTYRAFEDEGGTDITLVLTSDRFAEIPHEVMYGAKWMKVTGAGQRTVDFMFKS